MEKWVCSCQRKYFLLLLFCQRLNTLSWDLEVLGSPCHLPANTLEQSSLESECEHLKVKIKDSFCITQMAKVSVQEHTCGIGSHPHRPVQAHESRKELFYPSHASLQKQLSNHPRAYSGNPDAGWTDLKAGRLGISCEHIEPRVLSV